MVMPLASHKECEKRGLAHTKNENEFAIGFLRTGSSVYEDFALEFDQDFNRGAYISWDFLETSRSHCQIGLFVLLFL
jgi:hypothetical protein